MMISPELYKEQNLKGRSKEEIFKLIKELRKEISELVQIEDTPDSEPSPMLPGRRTIISCDREYLKAAIEAYEETGGVYNPSDKERRELEFNNSLNHLGCVKFTLFSFVRGSEVWICTIEEEDVLVRRMDFMRFPDEGQPAESKDEFRITKEEFFEGIKELHVTEWKRSYMRKEIVFDDGGDWSLEFFYYGPEKTRKYTGSGIYPYNFDELASLLRMDW